MGFRSGLKSGDFECARKLMIPNDGRSNRGDEEMPVITHDLRMLCNGRIESGGFRAA